jgi:hypothetical protein
MDFLPYIFIGLFVLALFAWLMRNNKQNAEKIATNIKTNNNQSNTGDSSDCGDKIDIKINDWILDLVESDLCTIGNWDNTKIMDAVISNYFFDWPAPDDDDYGAPRITRCAQRIR